MNVLELALGLALFCAIEQIDDFLWSLLDQTDQVCLPESAIDDNFWDFRAEFFVFLAGLWEICDVAPKFSAVLEVDEEFSDIGMRAFEGIA